MTSTSLLSAETGTDLKDFVTAGGNQPFHTQLRRRLQKKTLREERLDIALRDDYWLSDRGIDLKKVLPKEETADGAKKSRTDMQLFRFQHRSTL
jgi:hypothetical protein